MSSGSVAQRVGRGVALEAGRSPKPGWSAYLQPLLLALIALPLTAYGTFQATTWLGQNFPGFLLMENAVIPTVSGFDWPPDKAAVFHAQVVAVDGQPVQSSQDVFAHLQARPIGAKVEYTLLRDGETRHIRIPIRRFGFSDLLDTYGIILLFGLTNLVLGLTIGFLQPHTVQGRVFALHTFAAGMYGVTSIFLHHPDFHLLNRLCLLIECVVGATFVHLALSFPVARGTARQRRWILGGCYGLSLGLFILALRGFESRPADLTALHAAYAYIALGLFCVATAMAYAFWENRDPRVRLQIKAVLPGVLLACAVPFLVFLNNAMAGRDVPMQSGLLAALPFYGSIAYAIAKHDLFDIDRVVRLSFIYAVLTLVVLSGYALTLQLGALFLPGSPDRGALVGVLFVLLLAFALNPLREGVQRVVDRALYRSRLDYRATVSSISELMTTLLDLRQVVSRVTQHVAEAMQLESISLVLFARDGDQASLWLSRQDGSLQREPAPEVEALVRTLQAARGEIDGGALSILARESDAEAVQHLLSRTHAVAVIPLSFGNRTSGAMLLGPKLSGLPFDSEAIDLLRTLANQTAIAVENARSYRALEDLNRSLDAKVREQTEALRTSNLELTRAYDDLKNAQAQLVQSEKMASLGQLVAGVAHELNNPASFVHGGLANLAEYLDRFVQVLQAYERAPLADDERAAEIADLRKRLRLDYLVRETPELLRVCFEGSERITKIVEDLRLFARADRGERIPIALQEGIESTLRLLGGRLNGDGISVERRYQDVPNVKADAGQLNQVWMNLLSNAIDALNGRAHPRIVIALEADRDEPGVVKIEIHDNGPGIPADVQEKIFEPFFSTKPIGKGVGLGLSIAYGAVRSHGGTIAVESAPGQGTTIITRLPASLEEVPSAPNGAPEHSSAKLQVPSPATEGRS